MSKLIDLTGMKINKLKVIKKSELKSGKQGAYWLCICDCGKHTTVLSYKLRTGQAKSCGCLLKKHGMSEHPLYGVWHNMKNRCYFPKDKSYKNYNGRGITVCGEWKNDLETFIKWALANGWKKGVLLDRRDNDGDYTPENCRFVGAGLSRRNKRLLRSDNKTGYCGVSFYKPLQRFCSRIKINGEDKYLGYFETPLEAAIAYDKKVIALNDGRPTNFKWVNNE